jgi:prolyl oligopeptidase
MKQFSILILTALMATSILASDFNPPETPQKPVTNELHGFEITDPYQWLEDKDDEQVSKWSHAQHDYSVQFIKENAKEYQGLQDEIRNYIDRDVKSSPFYRGMRQFVTGKKKGEQQSKLFALIDGEEKLIFDPMQIDPTGKTSMSGMAFTRDAGKVAIGTQFQGAEIKTYRIIDTETGEQLGDPIENLNSFSWTYDEEHAYITIRTAEMIKTQEPLKTYRHKISDGNDHSKDVFLIAPDDAKDIAGVWDTRHGGKTFFTKGDFYSNTLSVRNQGTDDEPVEIYSSKKFRAFPGVRDGKMYIFTNHEAPNFKVMVTELEKPDSRNWKDLIPESDVVLSNFEITSDYIVVQYTEDVLGRLKAYDKNGKFIKEIELPELGDVGGTRYHEETNTIFVTISTFTSPTKVYKLDGKTLEWEFYWQDDPPINTDNITSKQVFFESKDGTRVPMFIVHRKDIQLNGENPTIVYGYGGFNISMTPRFIGTTASFINRGGVYAIANLRGGSEYGEEWHQDGMLFKKQNTFDDFIAASEYLIEEGYTSAEKLACKGGSNGGLLVGAVVTQRPDLYKAAICAVPLLDMLRYHKFLIARYWIPEYGDPDKKEDFLNILDYSPYHNIRQGFNYPSMMVKAGENDTRVDPLHAKKFAAALQNNIGQENPIMLYVDFESGHGSGQSTDQRVENIELEWRFLMSELGM